MFCAILLHSPLLLLQYENYIVCINQLASIQVQLLYPFQKPNLALHCAEALIYTCR